MLQFKSILKTTAKLAFFTLALGLVFQAHGIVDIPAFETLMGVLGGGAVLAFAIPASATVEGSTPDSQSAIEAGITDNKIAENITRMRPSSNPLDTILRKTRKSITARSWEYEYYTSDIRGVSDTLSSPYNSATDNTSNTVNIVHELEVTNPHVWGVHDTGRINETNGANGRPIVFLVVKKDATTNKIYVVPSNGTGAEGTEGQELPDISSGATLTRLGAAKDDMAAQTSPYATYPEKDSNYAQRFMAQVEQGILAELHKKEIQWGYNDYRLQALYDMRRQMEFSALFGEKGKIWDPEKENWIYLTGGLTSYIDKAVEYTTDSITNSDFAAWGKDIFQGNSGSDQRILFAGDELMVQLAKVSTIEKQLEAGNTQVKFGIRFNKIETSFGEFWIYNHELLRDVGWSEKGIVLDINNIDRHVFRGMRTNNLDLDKSGQKHAKAQTIEEIFGLSLRYPETHAIIKPAEE